MFPSLIEATKVYWRRLDELDASYQQGQISLEEVDVQVAELMADLAEKRRTALTDFWSMLQHWLTEQREVLISLVSLMLVIYTVIYTWILTSPIS